MRVLVLGGSRFVGRAAALRLLREHEVTVLNRGSGTAPSMRIARLVADRTDAASVRDALAGIEPFDAIVDVSGLEPAQVTPTLDAVTDVFGALPSRYVFISTAAIYDPSGPVPPREDKPHPGRAEWADYSTFKVEIERLLHERDIEALTILRPPYIYGADNSEPREPWLWTRIAGGHPVCYPVANDARVQFCDIETLTDVIAAAVDGSVAPGTYNIGDPQSYSFAEYLAVLAQVCGRDATLVPVSRPDIDARTYFSFRDTDLLCNVSRIQAQGVGHPSLADGLAKAWAWWSTRLPAYEPLDAEREILAGR